MEQTPKVPQDPMLDLDQALGESQKIKVKHHEKVFELTRPEDLTPRSAAALWRAQKKMKEFQKAGVMDAAGKLSPEKAKGKWEEKMLEFILDAIRLISPELAEANLPLPKLMRVMEFYTAEVNRNLKKSGQGENQVPPSPTPSPA